MEQEIFNNHEASALAELQVLIPDNSADALQNTARAIVKMLGAPLCTIRLLDDNNMLALKTAEGSLKTAVYPDAIDLDDDCMGLAIRNNQRVMFKNLELLESQYNRRILQSNTCKSIMFIPVRIGRKPEGAITICSSDEITEDDSRLLDSFSSMVSSVMEKSMLQKHIRDLYFNAVKTLVKTIEAKDIYTKGHSVRVSKYASSIAKKLGFSQVEIEEAEITGILHDIGKIGVNDVILTKPDGLSEVEFQLIKQHPFLGSKILEPIGFSENIVNGTLLHHKRYDLKGYPFDVDIEELPIMPRIIGAADAFDAMTSMRPYKKPVHKGEAINEMKKLTGTQFCPQIVEVMEQLYQEDLL